ncbi:hypothetical protein [Bacillus cereus]
MNKLREMIAQAVSQDVIVPNDVMEWLTDNGWEYEMPTRMTIETILKENKVVYVWGRWEKK